VAEFIAEGVDADQLDRIKMQLRASQVYGRDNVNAAARRYGQALTQGLTIEDVQAWPAILQAVTAEDVIAAAQTVFNKDNAVTGWLVANEEQTQEPTE
jgi:zinc protease